MLVLTFNFTITVGLILSLFLKSFGETDSRITGSPLIRIHTLEKVMNTALNTYLDERCNEKNVHRFIIINLNSELYFQLYSGDCIVTSRYPTNGTKLSIANKIQLS